MKLVYHALGILQVSLTKEEVAYFNDTYPLALANTNGNLVFWTNQIGLVPRYRQLYYHHCYLKGIEPFLLRDVKYTSTSDGFTIDLSQLSS